MKLIDRLNRLKRLAGTSAVCLASALSGCASDPNMTPEQKQARDTVLFGALLTGIGAHKGNLATYEVGKVVSNYGIAKAGRSEVNVNVNSNDSYQGNSPQNNSISSAQTQPISRPLYIPPVNNIRVEVNGQLVKNGETRITDKYNFFITADSFIPNGNERNDFEDYKGIRSTFKFGENIEVGLGSEKRNGDLVSFRVTKIGEGSPIYESQEGIKITPNDPIRISFKELPVAVYSIQSTIKSPDGQLKESASIRFEVKN